MIDSHYISFIIDSEENRTIAEIGKSTDGFQKYL